MMQRLAVIGGSGFEKLIEGKRLDVPTRFGTSTILKGELGGKPFFFLSRHGPDHSIPPHEINHRANLWALADAGATDIISLCAVGSTRKRGFVGRMLGLRAYDPGNIVIVRDLFKPTPGPTFFDSFADGPKHTDMSEPYHPELIEKIQRAAMLCEVKIKDGATISDTAGPRYETKAEVKHLARNDVDLVGMTTVSEAILANELRTAGYNARNATIAIVTNYGTGVTKAKLSHDEVGAMVKQREEDVTKLIYQLVLLI